MGTEEAVVIGAGPAGLFAAYELLLAGADVTLIDRAAQAGGQLVKQTHKFFGSKEHYASIRGIDIRHRLEHALEKNGDGRLRTLYSTTVAGFYADGALACMKAERYFRLHPEVVVVATGASERTVAFAGNDLPGVYAAGAVQTLMNEQGIRPGNRALMVGSGNIGLIVAYQLMQAGIQVERVVEAADQIGGYQVHASKLRRLGVPIETKTTIKRAFGTNQVEGAEIWRLDAKGEGIAGSEERLTVDTVCLAVGLSPLVELLSQLSVDTRFIPEFGGVAPVLDETYMTSRPGVFACGDVANVEEASTAMVEGRLAGIHAAGYLNRQIPRRKEKIQALETSLRTLRSGPASEHVRKGLRKVGEHA